VRRGEERRGEERRGELGLKQLYDTTVCQYVSADVDTTVCQYVLMSKVCGIVIACVKSCQLSVVTTPTLSFIFLIIATATEATEATGLSEDQRKELRCLRLCLC